MFRSFVGKIHRRLSVFVHRRSPPALDGGCYFDKGAEAQAAARAVPDDVMEGHFAVIATKGEQTTRFIVELDYLTDPAFLGLLDLAGEEYGFGQKGALAVPCGSLEFQKILDDRRV